MTELMVYLRGSDIWNYLTEYQNKRYVSDNDDQGIWLVYMTDVVLCMVQIITSLLFFNGALKRRPTYALPWFIIYILSFSLYTGFQLAILFGVCTSREAVSNPETRNRIAHVFILNFFFVFLCYCSLRTIPNISEDNCQLSDKQQNKQIQT